MKKKKITRSNEMMLFVLNCSYLQCNGHIVYCSLKRIANDVVTK